MFFTRIGKLIAYLVFGLGILRVGMGVFVAFITPDMESNVAASRRYLATATSGEAIDKGTTYILVAVVLGVLCEISARRSRPDEQA